MLAEEMNLHSGPMSGKGERRNIGIVFWSPAQIEDASRWKALSLRNAKKNFNKVKTDKTDH